MTKKLGHNAFFSHTKMS